MVTVIHSVVMTEAVMIPRFLLAAVAARLAVEGYSLMTAPSSLIRAVVARLSGERHQDFVAAE
jgi:hypothetical protein